MKMLIISDGHGAVDNLHFLSSIAKNVDMVVFAGDFAAFNRPETGLPFLNELRKLHENVYSVLGNCDHPSFLKELIGSNINVQAFVRKFYDFVIIGSGGASKFTGATPNERTDEDLAADILENYKKKEGDNVILITHNPPYGAKVDKVAPMVHVGSKLIRKIVEDLNPIISISGHIHEARCIDYIEETLVINPGALCDGYFAIAEVIKENGRYIAKAKIEKIP